MATIYKDAEHKYVACTVIFITDGNNYCYHDYAMTKKMTAVELREAALNGALVVHVAENAGSGLDNNTPPDKFKHYKAIKEAGLDTNNSFSITVSHSPSDLKRYSAEYTA